MVEIDALEDQIAPLEVKVSEIRDLISSFELCHHKAERWAENLVEAIGSGEADKGLGTRSPGVRHPVETVWQNACTALSAWCAGRPSAQIDLSVGGVPANELLSALGEEASPSLALPLDKTIRLQMDPPSDARAMAALAGPDWISH